MADIYYKTLHLLPRSPTTITTTTLSLFHSATLPLYHSTTLLLYHYPQSHKPDTSANMLPQLLLSALFTASALSAAVPSPIPEAHALAASRGIDITGPIPSDATPITGGYSFTADSDAAIWVRAQLTPSSIEKRQLANIGIGMFAGQNCLGEGSWIDNVSYGSQTSRSVQFMSVGISYRGLVAGEHLDFSKSTSTNLNLCGTYVYSAAPFTQIGCFNSQPINCFRLWR